MRGEIVNILSKNLSTRQFVNLLSENLPNLVVDMCPFNWAGEAAAGGGGGLTGFSNLKSADQIFHLFHALSTCCSRAPQRTG